MSKDKIVNGYYQSNITTSRGENITYTTEYTIDKLQQENKQLKLDYELYKDNHIYKNYEVETKDNTIEQLKEVIEEVRGYIESKNNGVCRVNGEEKPAYTFLLDFREAREFVWELLQILDKVKGE